MRRPNSPYTNHFISPDTVVPDPYNSQYWDRYAYALNNPVRYSDPSGHDVDCAFGDSNSYCLNRPRVKSLWDPKHPCYCDKKAAEDAYLHFLDDPMYFIEQYVSPTTQSDDYANLQIFTTYSELGTSADSLIWNVVAKNFGPDVANDLYDTQLRNVQAFQVGEPTTKAETALLAAGAIFISWKGQPLAVSVHALQQIQARGLTVNEVESIVNSNGSFFYTDGGILKRGWYDKGQQILVASGVDDEVITTVMINVQPKHVGDLKNRK